jgi:hypothetical protein
VAIVLVLIGLATVGVVVRDVVHELFHPAGAGTFSRALRRATWRVFRRLAEAEADRLSLAGPATLLVVIASWTVLSAFGWALVYVSFMPQSFQYASSLTPSANGDFGTALYVSLTALGTLGFGDVTPTTLPLRLAVTLEGLQGFLILTAGISWALAIKPVLAERRALAAAIHALLAAEQETDMPMVKLPADDLRPVLLFLTEQLTLAGYRLLQSPETYYFRARPRDASLAAVLPRLLEIVAALEQRAEPGIRMHATTLRQALDRLGDVLAEQFVDGRGDTAAALDSYAEDHMRHQSRARP